MFLGSMLYSIDIVDSDAKWELKAKRELRFCSRYSAQKWIKFWKVFPIYILIGNMVWHIWPYLMNTVHCTIFQNIWLNIIVPVATNSPSPDIIQISLHLKMFKFARPHSHTPNANGPISNVLPISLCWWISPPSNSFCLWNAHICNFAHPWYFCHKFHIAYFCRRCSEMYGRIYTLCK